MEKIKNAVIFLLFTYPFGIFLGISFWLFRFLGLAKVYGWKNFPSRPKGILAVSNHPSLLEPIILIGLFFHKFFWRPFKYAPWNMPDKKNYYNNPLFYLMRPRLIPVDRGDKHSEVRALIQAKRVLKAGGVIIIFPEGGRTSSEEPSLRSRGGEKMRSFKPGFAWLAIKTGATVLPLWVRRTDQVLPNGARVSYLYFLRFWKRVTIRLGQPLRFDETASVEAVAEEVQAAVLGLADQRGD